MTMEISTGSKENLRLLGGLKEAKSGRHLFRGLVHHFALAAMRGGGLIEASAFPALFISELSIG
jgi:hypothetical protein